jgi:hypothetical protein
VPLGLVLAGARATPVAGADEDAQGLLADG